MIRRQQLGRPCGPDYNASGMTAYYDLWNASGAATSMSLVTMTKGTWTSLGFVAVDGTNMPGVYQLGIPNAALTGATGVTIYLKGATNMVPVVIQIELTATSNQDGSKGGMTALPNADAGASGGLPLSVDASGRVDVLKVNGTSQTARDLGASVLVSNGTGTGQISLSSGAVLLQATQTGVTIPTVTNLTNAPTSGDLTATMKTSVTTAASAATPVATLSGDFSATMKTSLNAATPASVTGAVGSVTGAVGSVTGGVTVTTNNDKTGYALTAGEHTNIGTDVYGQLNLAFTDATSLNANSLLDRLRSLGWIIRNQIAITDSTGAGTIYKDDNATTAFSVSLTDNATTTTRTRAA